MNSSVINLFMIYSPLHYVCVESIVAEYCSGERTCLLYLRDFMDTIVRGCSCDTVEFLPWPRYHPEPGRFGSIVRARKNLERIRQLCSGYGVVRIHAPLLNREPVNFAVNHLRRSFPGAVLSVRLVPDGVLNIQRHPLSFFNRVYQYLRKSLRIVAPELDYYPFSGDRTGSDDPIVDRIYTLPRFPHEYDRDKTVELPSFRRAERMGLEEGAALIVGQPLVRDRRVSAVVMEELKQSVSNLLKGWGATKVDYKCHPREEGGELFVEGYRMLAIREPIETFLAGSRYQFVIGVYSTALLTARLIMPPECRVIAYGIDEINYEQGESKSKVEAVFRKLGVETIPHRTPSRSAGE